MKKNNKKKKWIKFRHKALRFPLYLIIGTYSRIRYGIKVERFKKKGDLPYLVLYNHQTAFDQFFVGMAFNEPLYYLASEDLFSNGWVSSLIKWLVAPIPIKKQTTDVKAILNCIRVAKEGGSIAIAPEGNRTYSGKTEYMSSSIVPLARKLNMPIALYRIEGGYGTHPRWSDVIRHGKMRSYVSRVVYPNEYATMTDDELFEIIQKELYVNEAVADAEFKHKRLAEYLERAIYVCPYCGLAEFKSNMDIIECQKCNRKVRYTNKKELVGVDFEFPFHFVADWYEYQSKFMNNLDPEDYIETPIQTDGGNLFEVIPYEKKVPIDTDVKITLYGNRIVINTKTEEFLFPFEQTSAVTVLGRNKLNIYYDGKIYQIKPPARFNALKYVHMYHRFRNVLKGDKDEQFLGL